MVVEDDELFVMTTLQRFAYLKSLQLRNFEIFPEAMGSLIFYSSVDQPSF